MIVAKPKVMSSSSSQFRRWVNMWAIGAGTKQEELSSINHSICCLLKGIQLAWSSVQSHGSPPMKSLWGESCIITTTNCSPMNRTLTEEKIAKKFSCYQSLLPILCQSRWPSHASCDRLQHRPDMLMCMQTSSQQTLRKAEWEISSPEEVL